jgi:hypothetical protein
MKLLLLLAIAAAIAALILVAQVGSPEESYVTRGPGITQVTVSETSLHNPVDIQTIWLDGHLIAVARSGASGIAICELAWPKE